MGGPAEQQNGGTLHEVFTGWVGEGREVSGVEGERAKVVFLRYDS